MDSKFKLKTGVGLAVMAAGGLLSYKLLFTNTSYKVVRVIDGDTFETVEKQRIRIDGIEAPEKGMCGADAASKELSKLILSKKVYLKIRYVDAYKRLISDVYDANGNLVALKLMEKGAVIVRQRGEINRKLVDTEALARKNRTGLFGFPCTQDVNSENPECNIKGNVRANSQTRLYHLPKCRNYKLTQIQLYFGDKWFCTEKEAIRAGFVKADDCREIN